ncbi:MAG: InlB B-repeat-containing protein [Bacillus subtilis]|nr:InlB B-repeat-containing protein [Bacillus subtilis]
MTTRITVDYNASIGSLPILTPKPGYTVVWARTGFTNVTEDQTVYAIYYADGVEAVTFVDGAAIRSIISATDNPGIDEILTAASNLWNPSKAGYRFLGWYYESDWQTLVDIDDLKWSVLNGSISIYAKWELLLPFPTPTDVAVNSQTVSWIQDDLASIMPEAYIILINGTPYPILAADCAVNPTTGLISYTFANNVLTAAGTHQIAVKAVGDNVNQLSSEFC